MTSYGRSSEDSLPKVIICGLTENNMPKLVVCDDKNKHDDDDSERVCTGPCNQQNPFQKNIPKKPPSKPRTIPTPNIVHNPAISRLQADLYQKQLTIDNLQQALCCLQCEMDMLAKQNFMLNEKIQQAFANQECGRGRRAKSGCLEDRLNEFDENTRMLEKQVYNMENNVQAMKNELSAVQAERLSREQKSKVIMIPSGWCDPRAQSCAMMRPSSCPYRPSPCH